MGKLSNMLQPQSFYAAALRAGPGPYEARQSDQSALAQSMARPDPSTDPINRLYSEGIAGLLGLPSIQQSMAADRLARERFGFGTPEYLAQFIDSPLMPGVGVMAGTVGKVAGALDNLPMDEASRMARANELFPMDAYHGTPYAFDEFENGDLGYHFGTPEQANKRLREVMKYAGPDAAANVIPARINLRNPLQMRDVGEWKNPRAVAEALLETPVGKKNADVLQEIIDEADGLSSQFESASDWFDSPEAGGFLDEMRAMISAEGFDGVRYLNEVENAYGNVASLTPEASAQVARLRQQYEDIMNAVVARRGPVPDDPAQIDAWLASKPTPTPEEAARIDAITAEMERVRDAGAGDPHSYIVFDPANIRSRFAKFDPRNLGSGNILAGGAGGVGLLSLDAILGNDAEAGQ